MIGSLGSLKSSLNDTLGSTNNNNLKKDIDNSTKSIQAFKKAFNLGAIYVGAKKVWNAVKGISSDYIDMVETNNLFEVSMGKVVDQYGNVDEAQSKYYTKAIDFQNDMNEKLATNRAELEKYQAMYFSMLKSQGIDLDKSYLMSESLTKAGYDIASLYNLSVDDAMSKLKSGLAGQVEPLRKIGIDISESSLQKVLNEVGIDRSVQQLSYAEKEVARYIAIMQQGSQAQGDFVKTMDNSANQIKMFKNQLAELRQVAGSFIINTFGGIITYATAVIMVVKEILKAFANLFGYELDSGGTTGLSGISDSVEDIGTGLGNATKKAKEFKKQIMSFDEIHNIEAPTTSNGNSGSGSGASYGIDSKLLDSLTEWDNKMDGIKGKAQEIRDKMLEWLGFVRDDNGGWKLGEGLTNFEKILDVVKTIGTAILGWKVSSAITNLLKSLGIFGTGADSEVKAFKWAFGLTLTLTGIFAQWQGTEHLLNGDADLFTILETVLGTAGGAFGIATILSATKFGKTLSLPNKIMIGAGIMLTIQGIQVIADGINNDDWSKKLAGALEMGFGSGVTVGLVSKSWQLGIKTGIVVTAGAISFGAGWSIGEWLKENYGDTIDLYIKAVNLDVDKDNIALQIIKGVGIAIATAATALGDKIVETLKEAAKLAKEKVIDSVGKFLGENIVGGIKEGIKNATINNPIYQAIKDTVEKIIDAFKTAFGIHSPSTVARDEVGLYVGEGVLEGIAKGLGITEFKDKILKAWNTVKTWFTDIVKQAKVNISQKWEDIKGKWQNLTGNIKDKIANMKAKVASKWNDIKGNWQKLTGNIKDKTAGMKAKIATKWTDLKKGWNNLMDKFKDKIISVKVKIQPIIDNVKNWLNTHFIDKVNSHIPAWLGQIPRLAKGNVAKRETLAIFGEYPGASVNPEITAPQSILRETFRDEIKKAGISNSSQAPIQGNISISGNLVQGIAEAVGNAMRNSEVNVNIEAKTEDGVIVKKASQGFREYVMQTGELPFPVPV